MGAIHVRNVPDHVLAAIKRRARSHDRSMQKELLAILEQAAGESPEPTQWAPIQLVAVAVGGDSTWPRDEIYGDDGR